MIRPVFLFLFVTLTAGIAYGQSPPQPIQPMPPPPRLHTPSKAKARPAVKPPIGFSAIDQSADEISKARPEVSDETLTNDAEVVESSLLAIRSVFSKRGFDNSDAEQATLQGWKELRIKQLGPGVALSPQALIKCVTGFGRLLITSVPDGALIEIDGNPAKDASSRPETTTSVRWAPSGEHRIRLTLVGYEPLEDTCIVEEGKPARFERTMKKLEMKQ